MFTASLTADLAQMGIGTSDFDGAMQVLGDWIGSDMAQIVPVAIDWERFKGIYEMRGKRLLLSNLGKRGMASASIDDRLSA